MVRLPGPNPAGSQLWLLSGTLSVGKTLYLLVVHPLHLGENGDLVG